jgi:hypothetical protein
VMGKFGDSLRGPDGRIVDGVQTLARDLKQASQLRLMKRKPQEMSFKCLPPHALPPK